VIEDTRSAWFEVSGAISNPGAFGGSQDGLEGEGTGCVSSPMSGVVRANVGEPRKTIDGECAFSSCFTTSSMWLYMKEVSQHSVLVVKIFHRGWYQKKHKFPTPKWAVYKLELVRAKGIIICPSGSFFFFFVIQLLRAKSQSMLHDALDAFYLSENLDPCY